MTVNIKNRFYGVLLLCSLLMLPLLTAVSQIDASELSAAPTDQNHPVISSSIDLKLMLECASNPEKSSNIGPCEYDLASLKQDAPLWPVYAFLIGEIYHKKGQTQKALNTYKDLVSWAYTDPYGDNWGVSPLVGISLWRWARLVAAQPEPDFGETKILFTFIKNFRKKRLIRCLFSKFLSISITFPQIEEDILRQQVLLAYKVGQQELAKRLFLEYIASASLTSLSEVENRLLEDLIKDNIVSVDRLYLLRGKRQLSLKRLNEAKALLEKAWQSDDFQVRAEAGLHLAELLRKRGYLTTGRKQVVEYLDDVIKNSTNPDIFQTAVYNRALILNREGAERNAEQFLTDLNLLLDKYPEGRLADDALLDFGSYYMNTGEYEKALLYLSKLQNFPGQNDWTNLSYFKPAMVLYTRAGPGDLQKADQLLDELDRRYPDGPLHFPVLFWRGRIASDSGDKNKAAQYYKQIVKSKIRRKPDEYYFTRALMHLHSGPGARKLLVPDKKTQIIISEAYTGKKDVGRISRVSPYHQRISSAVDSGFYPDLLRNIRKLRAETPSRQVSEMSIAEMDNNSLITHLSLLISLRQDALAAIHKDYGSRNLIQIAKAVGLETNDESLAMSLLLISSNRLSTIRQYQDYIRIAYPNAFNDIISRYAEKYQIKPELLHSVIRKESYFDPDAISPYGALGFFQFTPILFSELNEKWNLLGPDTERTGEAYLLDPTNSIKLGARWFKEILLKEWNNNSLYALISHNAGMEAMQEWLITWERVNREDDIEYIVETVRFLETRHFLRWVLTDMAILSSMNVFDKVSTGGLQE